MILLATIALVGIGYTLIEIAYNFINLNGIIIL